MSEELECFRKAVELGCEDFDTNEAKDVGLWHGFIHPFETGMQVHGTGLAWLPHNDARINRVAAAMCAEFFYQRRWNAKLSSCDRNDAQTYSDDARAFGQKYGKAT